MTNPYLTALVGLAVFALILYRQLRTQPVGGGSGYKRPLVFGAIGVVLATEYVLAHPVSLLGGAGFALSLVLAVGLSWLRARSVVLWTRDGVWWRRGTALTVVLWLCSLGTHLGLDALVGVLDPAEGIGRGFGSATTLVYLGLSLGLQHHVVLRRVRALEGVRGPVPNRERIGTAG